MSKKALLGFDIGSSSVKAALMEVETGQMIGSEFFPKEEMKINSPKPGFAEQDPNNWWKNLVDASRALNKQFDFTSLEICGIGISYQMHGLVVVDDNHEVLYPSIIWCDSRAVEIGNEAFKFIGKRFCLSNFLNSPGNFTASKLKWIRENEPDVYKKIYKIMLPGEFIAMKLSGEILTTRSGLSEGIFWNFEKNDIADEILEHYQLDKNLLADVVDTFSYQGKLTNEAAAELGLKSGIPIGYRAGDQPNNAFSLNVLNPGEIATTAGTSGVVYGITDENLSDPESRVNGFAHVNYTETNQNKGILLCINGTGILNSWLRNELLEGKYSYEQMNDIAAAAPIGSNGLKSFPYGNGAERSLGNIETGGEFVGINFPRHSKSDLIRSSQEGIAFAFKYGVEVMKGMGMNINVLRAGYSNMFLSPIFSEAIANACEAKVELYNTDGALGAARGAGIGVGIYGTFEEAFKDFSTINTIEPDKEKCKIYNDCYQEWKSILKNKLS